MNVSKQQRLLQDKLKKLVPKANKRIARLESSGVYSPALNFIKNRGIDKFSAKIQDYNDMEHMLSLVNNFLNTKTSLLREAKKFDIAYLKIIDKNETKGLTIEEKMKLQNNLINIGDAITEKLINEGSYALQNYKEVASVIMHYSKENDINLKKDVNVVDISNDLLEIVRKM